MKRIKNVLKIVSVFALVAAVLTGCGSSSSSKKYRTLDEIKEDGTIKIGVFSDKNPFGYVDSNGDYQGYDVYFANRLVKDLGVKVEFVSTEAASRVEYLETGKVDIVLANFTVTEEEQKKLISHYLI